MSFCYAESQQTTPRSPDPEQTQRHVTLHISERKILRNPDPKTKLSRAPAPEEGNIDSRKTGRNWE